MKNFGHKIIDDLTRFSELDDDPQAYELALREGGYDDGSTFGVHVEDDSFFLDPVDEEEEIDEDSIDFNG